MKKDKLATKVHRPQTAEQKLPTSHTIEAAKPQRAELQSVPSQPAPAGLRSLYPDAPPADTFSRWDRPPHHIVQACCISGVPRYSARAFDATGWDCDLVPLKGSNIVPGYWIAWEEPRAVGDLLHVEKFFVRNLEASSVSGKGMPDRLMKAQAERWASGHSAFCAWRNDRPAGSRVLEAIYEEDFLGFSYGFRQSAASTMRWMLSTPRFIAKHELSENAAAMAVLGFALADMPQSLARSSSAPTTPSAHRQRRA
jgi:hypothetical protein